ncbi:MAG: Aminotransferase, partial [Microgenomates group bacterium GW2011_GWC1_43_11]
WDEVLLFSTYFISALKQEVFARKIFPVELSSIKKIIEEIIPKTGKFSDLANKKFFLFDKIDEYLIEPSQELALKALAEHFPQPEFSWSHPEGGLFIWATGPEGMVMEDVLKQAAGEKVAFVPGSPFFASDRGYNTMRLNFSFQSEEKIDRGMEILGRIVKANLP